MKRLLCLLMPLVLVLGLAGCGGSGSGGSSPAGKVLEGGSEPVPAEELKASSSGKKLGWQTEEIGRAHV